MFVSKDHFKLMVSETSKGSDNQESRASLEFDFYAATIEYRNAKFRRAGALVARGIGIVVILLFGAYVNLSITAWILLFIFSGGSFLIDVPLAKIEQLEAEYGKQNLN